MWPSTETSQCGSQEQMRGGPFERPRQGGIAASEEAGSATIILDKLGRIRYCNAAAARLFCAGARQLLGQDIRALVPDLPLRPVTPGYNLAYVVFWAAEGAWRPFTGRDGLGGVFRLQAWLDPRELESRQQILLCLRRARCLARPRRRFAGEPMLAFAAADRAASRANVAHVN